MMGQENVTKSVRITNVSMMRFLVSIKGVLRLTRV